MTLQLTSIEQAIYDDTGVTRESFYIGITCEDLKLGDILLRQNDKWVRKPNILNEDHAYVENLTKRSEIQNILDNPVIGNENEISLTGGVIFENSLENGIGVIVRPDLSLLDSMDGTLNIKAHFTQPNAYSIWCKGHWESLKSTDGFLDGIKAEEKKLATAVKDPEKVFILVTSVFKTSSDYVSFITSDRSTDFSVEVNGLKETKPSMVYQKLRDKINKEYQNSFEFKQASIVPFFRGAQIKPQWLVDGNFVDEPSYSEPPSGQEGKAPSIKAIPQPKNVVLTSVSLKT